MTIEELKATFSPSEITAIKTVAAKNDNITEEDKTLFVDYIKKASDALGEDQIAEPVRYIVAAIGGLRAEDLRSLIGEDFDAEIFAQWNNMFETPIIRVHKLNDEVSLYDLAPEMRETMRKHLGDNTFRSCVSDISYYLVNNLEAAGTLGAVTLRIAQQARLRQEDKEAQRLFIAALNYFMPPLQQADPKNVTIQHINQYWLCLKICQEMAQPKAIVLIFDHISKIEKEQMRDENRSTEERNQIGENVIGQYIDMSKTYHAMPKQLQEQFIDYTEPTISLLKSYLKDEYKPEEAQNDEKTIKLSGFFQALGELSMRVEHFDESYDALTQAQILQMRQLANLQKEDGEEAMSPQQLFCRLALSATNHMIAAHYRRKNTSQHDLGIVLRSNMNLAEDCFKFYARDPKVIHFFINAALELGDYQHNSRGLLAECNTYEKVIQQFTVLNNMQLDQQLAVDIAMIQTKCGQVMADKSIRRYKDAIRNFETALQLWKALGDNTKNPTFQNNAKAVMQMLLQLKGNK